MELIERTHVKWSGCDTPGRRHAPSRPFPASPDPLRIEAMIGDDLGGAQDFRVPLRIAIQRKPEHKFSGLLANLALLLCFDD